LFDFLFFWLLASGFWLLPLRKPFLALLRITNALTLKRESGVFDVLVKQEK
jgi:hypothetical protein